MIDNETEAALEVAQPTENKLYKIRDKAKSYPEISAQQKHDIIAAAVAQQRENLQRNAHRQRVDLTSAPAVEAEINNYLQSCEAYGQVPTLLGLAAYMGFSRVNLYQYIYHHPETETAKLLDSFRSASASIIAQASMGRTLDNATSIFLLKNCGQGLNDKQEVEITRGLDPAPRQSAEEIYQKYLDAGIELPD